MAALHLGRRVELVEWTVLLDNCAVDWEDGRVD